MAKDVAEVGINITAQNDTGAAFSRLKTDLESAAQGFEKLRGMMNSLHNEATRTQAGMNLLKGAILALGVELSISYFKNLISSAIESTAQLKRLSQETGVSGNALSALAGIGKMSGTSIDTITAAMNKLSKGMAGADEDSKGAAVAIKALGINFDEFSKMTPDQRMLATAKAMDQFKDGAGKTAAAMLMFGKSGAELLPMLHDLADVHQLVGKRTNEQIEMSEQYERNLRKLKASNEAWKGQLAMGVLPALSELSKAMLDVMNGTDGLGAEVKKLAADGTLAEWTRMAITGFTYLLDVGQALFSLIPMLGKAIAGLAASASAMFGAIIEAHQKFQFGDMTGAVAALAFGVRAVGSVAKDTGSDIADLWNQKLMGEKIREGMDAARNAHGEEKKMQQDLSIAAQQSASTAESAYHKLIAGINEKIAATKEELSAGHMLNEAEKMQIKMMSDLRDGTLKLTDQEVLRAKAKMSEYDADLRALDAKKEAIKLTDEMKKTGEANVKNIDEQIFAQKLSNEQIGLSKEQIGRLLEKKLLLEAASASALAQEMRLSAVYTGDMHDAYIQYAKDLDDVAAKKTLLAGLKADAGTSEMVVAAKADLDKLFDPTKGREFGNAIKGSIGEVVGAMAKMDAAIRESAKNQAVIDKARMEARTAYKAGSSELADAESKISKMQAEQTLNTYAQMAGAASGFFSQGSKGYKAMFAAEQVFRAAELALTVSGVAAKMLGIGVTTAAHVQGEVVKGAASVTGAAVIGGANTAIGSSAALAGVATQAMGDPYSAFARMAAMAAAMAALGFVTGAFGGGDTGGGQSAADVQKAQGSGGVFGDAEAKSDSIMKSIDMMQKTSSQLLPVNLGMLAALRNIESAMVGVTNLFVRSNGVTDGSNLGIKTGKVGDTTNGNDLISRTLTHVTKALGGPIVGDGIAKFINNLWGKSTQKIVDSGIQFGGNVNALASGQGFGQYASVDTTKSTWFGLSKSTSNSVVSGGLSGELSNQLGLIFSSMKSALTEAGIALGRPASEIEKTFANLSLSTQKISLKGLTGQALTDALNSGISKSLDEMAQAVFPQFDSFRAVGEGYAQTVLRVANTFATVNQAMGDLNIKLFAADKAGIGATVSLAELAGGLDKLQSQTADYYQNFFTESERTAKTMVSLTSEFSNAGLGALPKTRSEFRALMETLTDPAQIAIMLRLEGVFASVVPAATSAADATANLAKVEQDAAQAAALLAGKRSNLEIRIMELSGDAAGALAAKRKIELDGTDASLKGLQQHIYALEDKAAADAIAKAAFEKAAQAQQQAAQAAEQAAKQVTAAWQSVTDTIVSEIKRIRGQVDGNSSQSYAALQSQFAIATAQARSNNQDAAKSLPTISQALLTMAETQESTAQGLMRIRLMTANSLQDTATGFGGFGVTVHGFASGGDFTGGLRIVGENGPELEMTGASRIWSSSQTKSMLAGDDGETKALREEVAKLRIELNAALVSIAQSTEKTARILARNDTGSGIYTTTVLPA